MPTPQAPVLVSQVVTTFPTPAPTRSDPTNFPARGDAHAQAQVAFVPEMNTATSQMNALATRVNSNAVDANTSSVDANNSAAAAAVSAASAVAAATAANALASATSVTSVTIGAGAKSLTLDAPGIALAPGMWARIANTAAPGTNVMRGIVTTYNSGTRALVVDVREAIGSGTYTAWTVSPSSQLLAADLRAVDLARPRAVPSLLVQADVVDAIGLPPGVTFTRASTKLVRNDRGIYTTVGINAPPITHDVATAEKALLIEDTSTNYLTHSQAFENAAWTKTNANITTGFASPDGGTNARKIVANATIGTGAEVSFAAASFPAGPATLSVVANIDTTQWVCLEISAGANNARQWFNVGTSPAVGSATASTFAVAGARVLPDWSGSKRVEVTINNPSLQTLTAKVIAVDGNGSLSVTTGAAVSVWQLQFENYFCASSPIVTAGATATRSADTMTWTGFGAALAGATSCTIVASARSLNYINTASGFASLRYPALWAFGPNGNRHNHYGLTHEVAIGTAPSSTFLGAIAQGTHSYAWGIAAAGGQSRYAIDGGLVANLAGTGLGALTTLSIGHNAGNNFGGLIKELRVYPFAITDANLQSLSAVRP